MIHRLGSMIGSQNVKAKTDKGWVRAVPLPFYGGLIDRIRDAIEVIKGEAFVVYWPKEGEFEEARDQGVRPKTGYMGCKCGAYITASYDEREEKWCPNSYCPACNRIKMLEEIKIVYTRDSGRKREMIRDVLPEIEKIKW